MSGVLAILQARTSSSRLPGKVLLAILGEPMILREIDRIKRAHRLTGLIVATSDDRTDDPLAELCRSNDIAVFRGSLNDVLDRFYQAAKPHAPDHVVRLTGDCPLIDPLVIDGVVEAHLSGGFDYTSNALQPTFPDGLDCEVMTFAALESAWREATLTSDREHVTPFLHRQPERFRLGRYQNGTDLSALRWTVDEASDFAVATAVYAALFPKNPGFGMVDVLQLQELHPEIFQANQSHQRNEGYAKSLRKDQEKTA